MGVFIELHLRFFLVRVVFFWWGRELLLAESRRKIRWNPNPRVRHEGGARIRRRLSHYCASYWLRFACNVRVAWSLLLPQKCTMRSKIGRAGMLLAPTRVLI